MSGSLHAHFALISLWVHPGPLLTQLASAGTHPWAWVQAVKGSPLLLLQMGEWAQRGQGLAKGHMAEAADSGLEPRRSGALSGPVHSPGCSHLAAVVQEPVFIEG